MYYMLEQKIKIFLVDNSKEINFNKEKIFLIKEIKKEKRKIL